MRFVLIHGYSGFPEDLAGLAAALEAMHGPGCVTSVALHPGWTGGPAPAWDTDAFLRAIRAALDASPEHPRVVVGHSTGGTLARLALETAQADRLVLIGTPPAVDASHLPRLERATRPGNTPPDFLDTARMAQAIRAASRLGWPEGMPVLILHGGEDPLVLREDAALWPPGATVRIREGAGHHPFEGDDLAWVLDALADATRPETPLSPEAWDRLRWLEPAVLAHAERSPGTKRAFGRSPSAFRALHPGPELPGDLGPLAPAPVILNLEATTRCPHACPGCARTRRTSPPRDLDPQALERILDQVPHAGRVTFVGLGEPTLNPDLPRLVARVSDEGRAAALVTSGAALTHRLADRLAAAGLSAATFSLDAGTPELAARLRPGVPFARTLQGFRAAAAAWGDQVPRSVFTAVGQDNAHHLDAVADLALDLGARAWMLSDLNFPENAGRSLAGAPAGPAHGAVRRAVDRALERGLPVLGIEALEELGRPWRLREFLLRPADRLWTRSGAHRTCLSPWQTVPVGADGSLTACDCQPDVILGNLQETPLMELWNGPEMRRLRQELLSGQPRAACRACPRL